MPNGLFEPAAGGQRKSAHFASTAELPPQAHGLLPRIVGRQSFWVMVTAVAFCLVLTLITDTFATPQNLFNVTRNFAFVAIIALGKHGSRELNFSSDVDLLFLTILPPCR